MIENYATLYPSNDTQDSSNGAFVLLSSPYLPSEPSPGAGSDGCSDSTQSSNDNILPSHDQSHTYCAEAALPLSGPSHEATELHADLHAHPHIESTTEHDADEEDEEHDDEDADEEDEEHDDAHVDGEVASISCCILLGEMDGNVRVFRTECNAELQRDKKMLRRHFTEHQARGELEWNLYRCPFTRLKRGICKPKESSPLDAVVGLEVLVNHVFSSQHFQVGALRFKCPTCVKSYERKDALLRHQQNPKNSCPVSSGRHSSAQDTSQLTEQATEEVVDLITEEVADQITEEVVEQAIEEVTELITNHGRRPAKRRRRG